MSQVMDSEYSLLKAGKSKDHLTDNLRQVIIFRVLKGLDKVMA